MLLHKIAGWPAPRERRITISLIVAFCLWAVAPSIVLSDDDERSEEPTGTTDVPTPTPVFSGVNVIAIHDSQSEQYDENCLECHAAIPSATSLDPTIEAAHPVMLSSTPGEDTEEKCVFCHRSVDLLQFSAGNLRRHVAATLCSVCHGPAGPSRQLYQTGITGNDPGDGAVLYDLVCSGCHRGLQDSEVEGESVDDIREAIFDDEGGMGPLEALTDPQIQAIAGALGGGGGGGD